MRHPIIEEGRMEVIIGILSNDWISWTQQKKVMEFFDDGHFTRIYTDNHASHVTLSCKHTLTTVSYMFFHWSRSSHSEHARDRPNNKQCCLIFGPSRVLAS